MTWNSGPSFIVGGSATSVAPGTVVKLDTTTDNAIVTATGASDEVVVGVAKRSQRDAPGITGSDTTIAAKTGESCEVYGVGDVAPTIAGGAITRGQYVVPTTGGQIVAAATGTNQTVVGEALESASGQGVEINIRVNPHRQGQL